MGHRLRLRGLFLILIDGLGLRCGLNGLVLSPEYGGDGGKGEGDCATKKRPHAAFPAHWDPEAIVFYTGSSFPAAYHGGAFVSFHGSWNRVPVQAGFLVAFVPF